jgi:hypothetical protein
MTSSASLKPTGLEALAPIALPRTESCVKYNRFTTTGSANRERRDAPLAED